MKLCLGIEITALYFWIHDNILSKSQRLKQKAFKILVYRLNCIFFACKGASYIEQKWDLSSCYEI
jgi:hypothetical protein